MVVYSPSNSEKTQPQTERGWKSKDKSHLFWILYMSEQGQENRTRNFSPLGYKGHLITSYFVGLLLPTRLTEEVFCTLIPNIRQITTKNSNMTD